MQVRTRNATRPLSRLGKGGVHALLTGRNLALCLDVDGTLAPIAPTPVAARVPRLTRTTLRRLGRRRGVTLILVSGRRAEDARAMVGVPVDWTLGNHGFELARRAGPAWGFAPGVSRREVAGAAARIRRAIAGLEGVVLEDKGWTLSVHFRRASAAAAPLVPRVVRDAVRGKRVRLSGGKRIVDVRPDTEWDKGRALVSLLERLYGRRWDARAAVIYAGDDTTDEHVFALLPRSALTIKVGPGRTGARYRTLSPRTLARWLARLEGTLR